MYVCMYVCMYVMETNEEFEVINKSSIHRAIEGTRVVNF